MRWHNCLAENLHSIAYFFKFKFASKKYSSENNKLVFHFSNQQSHVVLCWQNDRRNPKLFHFFYLGFHDALEWWNKENNNICTTCISFAHCVELIIISDCPQSWSAKLQQRVLIICQNKPTSTIAEYCYFHFQATVNGQLFLSIVSLLKTFN